MSDGCSYDGWERFHKLVEDGLEELKTSVKKLESDVNEMKIQFAVLETKFKFKSGVWGAIGSAIPILIALAFLLLRNEL